MTARILALAFLAAALAIGCGEDDEPKLVMFDGTQGETLASPATLGDSVELSLPDGIETVSALRIYPSVDGARLEVRNETGALIGYISNVDGHLVCEEVAK